MSIKDWFDQFIKLECGLFSWLFINAQTYVKRQEADGAEELGLNKAGNYLFMQLTGYLWKRRRGQIRTTFFDNGK